MRDRIDALRSGRMMSTCVNAPIAAAISTARGSDSFQSQPHSSRMS
jgi:hypothetical protein